MCYTLIKTILIIVQIWSATSKQSPATLCNNSEFKIVCNIETVAWHLSSSRSYTLEHIDEKLCTHIVFNIDTLNQIARDDSPSDIRNEFRQRVTDFKWERIPILIAIDNGLDKKSSELVNNASARTDFVFRVAKLIEKYNFDGLQLHWDYLPCSQNRCIDSDEKNHFTDLMREVFETFKSRGWLLSAVVLPWPSRHAYDIPELSKYVDWFSVSTYGYKGHYSNRTGHFAPRTVAIQAIEDWIKQGAPNEKLLMGLPMTGAEFILKDESEHNVGAPVGTIQRDSSLSFFDVLLKVNSSYTVVHDQNGTYAYFAKEWITYDDVKDIERKAEYIRQMSLGGAFISAINEDDFLGHSSSGRCCEKYPLLTTVNRIFRMIVESNIEFVNCT